MAVDCLIVGAGPVGLTLASRLQQYGLSYRLLEKHPEPVRRTKAAAVWSRTSEVLAQMGLAEQFTERGLPCYGAGFFMGGKRVARLTLDSIDSRFNFVLMIPQHETERLLRENLEQQGRHVEFGSGLSALEQSASGVKATLDSGEVLESSWLVGCDGAHSTVRGLLDLEFTGRKLESQWIVGDIVVEGLPFDDEVLLFMHEEGPTGLFPMGEERYRLVAETEPLLDDSNLGRAAFEVERIAQTRLVKSPLKVKKVEQSGYFSIHERQVSHYRKGRVFLAGDAAHVQSPLGGQGMNTGMQDADNLAWKLALVARGLLTEEVLDTYHEERHPVGKWLVEATSRGTQIITERQPILASFRNQAARLVAALPPVQNKLRNTLSELEIHYKESSLSREAEYVGAGWKFHQGVPAGCRAPDGVVLYRGEERYLSHFFQGCRFHLLLFNSEGKSDLLKLVEAVTQDYEQLVNPLWILPHPRGDRESVATVLEDTRQELHHLYAAVEASAYLIRPDGYVAYRCQPVDQVELLNYLDRWSATT